MNEPKFGLKSLADKLIPLVILVAFWSIVASVIKAERGIDFPGPIETLTYLASVAEGGPWFNKTLYAHVGSSMKRFLIGFAAAAAFGIAFGLLMGYSKTARKRLYPIVSIMQPIPSVTWIPVAIMLFGLGDVSTIFIIFMASIWPTTVNTVAGAESVPENYLRLARMYQMKNTRILSNIVVPHSVPYILNGLRISVANAWRSLVAAEMIAASGVGLGYVIIQSRWNLDYTSALAGMVIIAIFGYLIEKVVFHHIESKTLEKWGMSTT